MSGVCLHALGDINRLNSAVADLGNAVGALRAIWARSRTKSNGFFFFFQSKFIRSVVLLDLDTMVEPKQGATT